MFVFVLHTNYEKQNREICFSYIEAQTIHFFAKSMQWRGSSSWHFGSCAEWAHLKPKHQTQCWWNLGISRVGPVARPGPSCSSPCRSALGTWLCTWHCALHCAYYCTWHCAWHCTWHCVWESRIVSTLHMNLTFYIALGTEARLFPHRLQCTWA